MNIVDALIQKGSTGGNNIAEAIENLPEIGGSGTGTGGNCSCNISVITVSTNNGQYVIDKTYDELYEMAEAGGPVMVYFVPYSASAAQVTMYLLGDKVVVITYYITHTSSPSVSSVRTKIEISPDGTYTVDTQTYSMNATTGSLI